MQLVRMLCKAKQVASFPRLKNPSLAPPLPEGKKFLENDMESLHDLAHVDFFASCCSLPQSNSHSFPTFFLPLKFFIFSYFGYTFFESVIQQLYIEYLIMLGTVDTWTKWDVILILMEFLIRWGHILKKFSNCDKCYYSHYRDIWPS